MATEEQRREKTMATEEQPVESRSLFNSSRKKCAIICILVTLGLAIAIGTALAVVAGRSKGK